MSLIWPHFIAGRWRQNKDIQTPASHRPPLSNFGGIITTPPKKPTYPAALHFETSSSEAPPGRSEALIKPSFFVTT